MGAGEGQHDWETIDRHLPDHDAGSIVEVQVDLLRSLLASSPNGPVSDFPPTIEELFETFDDLPEWDERYDFIIDLGRELPSPTDELHQPENLVEGCMSTVWLKLNPGPESSDPLEIQADSDSLIVKGLIVILLAFYASKSAAEIIASDVSQYLKRLGLDQHLSPQRRNGLFSMIKRINALAQQAVA